MLSIKKIRIFFFILKENIWQKLSNKCLNNITHGMKIVVTSAQKVKTYFLVYGSVVKIRWAKVKFGCVRTGYA